MKGRRTPLPSSVGYPVLLGLLVLLALPLPLLDASMLPVWLVEHFFLRRSARARGFLGLAKTT